MAKKKPARKTVKKSSARARRPKTAPRRPKAVDPLFAPVKGAERREVGHVRLEVGRAGAARVKRMIYPPGFRWSVDMKPSVGTDLCMHAHVGFLASGEIHIEYADGCVIEHKAPQIVVNRTGTRRLGRGQETGRPDRIRLRERYGQPSRDARRAPAFVRRLTHGSRVPSRTVELAPRRQFLRRVLEVRPPGCGGGRDETHPAGALFGAV